MKRRGANSLPSRPQTGCHCKGARCQGDKVPGCQGAGPGRRGAGCRGPGCRVPAVRLPRSRHARSGETSPKPLRRRRASARLHHGRFAFMLTCQNEQSHAPTFLNQCAAVAAATGCPVVVERELSAAAQAAPSTTPSPVDRPGIALIAAAEWTGRRQERQPLRDIVRSAT